MTKALIGLALALITSTLLLGLYSYEDAAKLASLENSKDRGKLSWYADMAKAKGQQETVFRAPIESYAVPRSLDEALAHHYLLLIQPTEQKAYAVNESIRTWYKFKVIETLSSPTVFCADCGGLETAPSDLLPLKSDEILASQSGGEIAMDGVRIISKDPDFPAFEKGKKYLVFLSLDSQKQVGMLQMGPWGTFGVDEKDQLNPVNEKLQHSVKHELTVGYEDSVSKLRSHRKKTNTRLNGHRLQQAIRRFHSSSLDQLKRKKLLGLPPSTHLGPTLFATRPLFLEDSYATT